MPRRYRSEMSTSFARGFDEGYEEGLAMGRAEMRDEMIRREYGASSRRRSQRDRRRSTRRRSTRRKPVKLSKWQKYIKNKKNHIKLRNGKLNLKKMAVQYRKKKKR